MLDLFRKFACLITFITLLLKTAMNKRRPSYAHELALKQILAPKSSFYYPPSHYGVTEEVCWNYVKNIREGIAAHFNYLQQMEKCYQKRAIWLLASGSFIFIALFVATAIMDGNIQDCIGHLIVAENAERLKEAEL